MEDTMQFVKYSELKIGMVLRADAGFTCLVDGQLVNVEYDMVINEYFVRCNDGKHYLKGQLDFNDHDTLVGLELISETN
jgi:hypothetical protein